LLRSVTVDHRLPRNVGKQLPTLRCLTTPKS